MRASTLIDHLVEGMADHGGDFEVGVTCANSKDPLPLAGIEFRRILGKPILVIEVVVPDHQVV